MINHCKCGCTNMSNEIYHMWNLMSTVQEKSHFYSTHVVEIPKDINTGFCSLTIKNILFLLQGTQERAWRSDWPNLHQGRHHPSSIQSFRQQTQPLTPTQFAPSAFSHHLSTISQAPLPPPRKKESTTTCGTGRFHSANSSWTNK